ncbi:hypothetical protein F5B17DRAFT_408426 [Nemania serpens]|nr:hypothetical protein F5B17DRAFT_408426 [Nemania serpens]
MKCISSGYKMLRTCPKPYNPSLGLTVAEIDDLNPSLGKYPLLYSNKSKPPKNTDVVVTSGAHFCVISKNQDNKRTMVLDYSFKKTQPRPKGQVSTRKSSPAQQLAKATVGGAERRAVQCSSRRRPHVPLQRHHRLVGRHPPDGSAPIHVQRPLSRL